MPRGRKRLPWIKLWFEILGDPKMTRLSSAEKWYWIGILLLAGQAPIRGRLMLTDTEPMSIDDIAAALSLPPAEIPALESCIGKLKKLGSVIWNSTCLEVVHFKERQEVYESDFKDYHKSKPIYSELIPEKVLKEEEVDVEVEVKEIYSLWNSLGVIKHRKLTGQVMRAIKATLRDFSAAEISQAMKNYALLKRGLEKFLDLEVALNNYRKGGANGVDRKRPRQLKARNEYTTPEEWRQQR